MSELGYTMMLLGAGQGAILSVVLARREQNRLANRILAALAAGVGLMLALNFLGSRWGDRQPHLLGLGAPLPYLFAPLQWLYIAALTRPLSRLEPRQLMHALPFVAFAVFMMLGFYFRSAEAKMAVVAAVRAGKGPASVHIMSAMQVVQAVAYLGASFILLRRYRQRIEQYYSDLHRIDLRWLTILVGAHAVVWSIVLANFLLTMLDAQLRALDVLRPAVMIGSTFVIFLIGYISLWQGDLFQTARDARRVDDALSGERGSAPPLLETRAELSPAAPEDDGESEPEVVAVAASRDKYQRNRLDDAEAAELVRALEILMTERQLFRDGSLTSQVLAEALGITPHLLSQVLNVHIGKSFYAFVNGYRVEALMAALEDPAEKERGVFELALDVGFNSKSTVNSAFKKHTGQTPTQFRANVAGAA